MNTWGAILEGLQSLFQWWVNVMPWEDCVRVRCGRWTTRLGPGIHLRLPIFDRTFKQGMRFRAVDVGTVTVRTNNGKSRSVSGILQYQIGDLLALYETMDDAEDTLVGLARAALAEAVEAHDDTANGTILGRWATRRLGFKRYGIQRARVRTVDLVDARTIRLMQDDKPARQSYSLDTVGHDA